LIIVQLNGGLGNQMFQYALGRNLAIRNRTELFLDISEFEHYKLRAYELSHFCVVENILSVCDLRKIMLPGWRKKWNMIKKRLGVGTSAVPVQIIREKQKNFDPTVLALQGNLYLCGYWQREKYFQDIEDIIRQEFSLRFPMSLTSQGLAQEMMNTDSLAIHVRRGDYVTNPTTNDIHGTMPIEYYQQAIEYVKARCRIDGYYVFSDDREWVENHFGYLDNVKFFSGNTCAHEDMILMSKCKHNIIANSSYSWWGAWLNDNPAKIVIAPRQWVRASERNLKEPDRIPDGWVKI
jgi:hypothetical protein